MIQALESGTPLTTYAPLWRGWTAAQTRSSVEFRVSAALLLRTTFQQIKTLQFFSYLIGSPAGLKHKWKQKQQDTNTNPSATHRSYLRDRCAQAAMQWPRPGGKLQMTYALWRDSWLLRHKYNPPALTALPPSANTHNPVLSLHTYLFGHQVPVSVTLNIFSKIRFCLSELHPILTGLWLENFWANMRVPPAEVLQVCPSETLTWRKFRFTSS